MAQGTIVLASSAAIWGLGLGSPATLVAAVVAGLGTGFLGVLPLVYEFHRLAPPGPRMLDGVARRIELFAGVARLHLELGLVNGLAGFVLVLGMVWA